MQLDLHVPDSIAGSGLGHGSAASDLQALSEALAFSKNTLGIQIAQCR